MPLPLPPRPLPPPHPHPLLTRTHRCSSRTCSIHMWPIGKTDADAEKTEPDSRAMLQPRNTTASESCTDHLQLPRGVNTQEIVHDLARSRTLSPTAS